MDLALLDAEVRITGLALVWWLHFCDEAGCEEGERVLIRLAFRRVPATVSGGRLAGHRVAAITCSQSVGLGNLNSAAGIAPQLVADGPY